MRVLFLIFCLAVNLIYAKEQTQKQINIEHVTTTQDICEKSFFFYVMA